jgi:hypothetical protein
LNAIRGRLDFSPSSNLSPELKEKLQDGLAHFITFLIDIGFQGLDDRVSVHIFSKEEPLQGQFADQNENINAFYVDKVLYIHRAMADDLSVALREYSHHALEKGSQHPVFDTDVENGLADYFSASFLESPLIGGKLGSLFGLPTPFIRNLDNSLRYPAVPNEPHSRGAVWAGALWACRQATERAAVDRVAFEAWKAASHDANAERIDQRFGGSLLSASGRAGECLTREIARRGLPRLS